MEFIIIIILVSFVSALFNNAKKKPVAGGQRRAQPGFWDVLKDITMQAPTDGHPNEASRPNVQGPAAQRKPRPSLWDEFKEVLLMQETAADHPRPHVQRPAPERRAAEPAASAQSVSKPVWAGLGHADDHVAAPNVSDEGYATEGYAVALPNRERPARKPAANAVGAAAIMYDLDELKRAVVMKEILDPPRALAGRRRYR